MYSFYVKGLVKTINYKNDKKLFSDKNANKGKYFRNKVYQFAFNFI